MAVGFAPGAINSFLDTHFATTYPWIQLHTGDPGAAGTANIAGNATRLDIGSSWTAAAAGSKTTNADIEWSDAQVDTTETYTHCSFWTATSGGTFGGSGTVTAAQVDATGEAFRIPSGSITASVTPVAA